MSDNKLRAIRHLLRVARGNLALVQEAIGAAQPAERGKAPSIEAVEREIRARLAARQGEAA